MNEMNELLSIIIPAYNEESRIGPTLDSILNFLSRQSYRAQLIVVDDGSKDRTAAVASEWMDRYRAANHGLFVVTNDPNRGKGYSIRRGVAEARGSIILFTDADLSSPITEAPKLLDPIIRGTVDVAFGSRALNRKLIGIRQPLLRDFRGRIFNILMRLATGLPFKDTQCGFKAFRREAAVAIFSVQRIEGFGFDPEVLYIARKHDFKMLEIPVIWNHCEGSKVGYFLDSVKVFADLVAVRINDFRGIYGLPSKPAAAEAEADSIESRSRAGFGDAAKTGRR
jgi:glycosyltransferase involved in cell wall biosynthesis